MNLLPEEAYYWLYAQHLDIGYLDHPPMVAWLIKLGTLLAGNTEFGVRIGACLCWIVATFFMFRLAGKMFGRASAWGTAILMAILPAYFGTGLLMTPDAPLYACWAGCLYCLGGALLDQKRSAWYGAGICMGMGLLAKYTMALLAPACLVFVLLDRRSRFWLACPEPYLAVVLAAVIFSPVIVWNATHDWASFAFQGPRRMSEGFTFSLHVLLGHVLLLLTPLGLAAIVQSLASKPAPSPSAPGDGDADQQTITGPAHRLFAASFVLAPLGVFVIFSLIHVPKLNWTGPAFLAVLPLVAWRLVTHYDSFFPKPAMHWGRIWIATAAILLIIYGGSMSYLVCGAPEAHLGLAKKLPLAWKQVGCEVQHIRQLVRLETGRQPAALGLDKNATSSEIAFYDHSDNAVGDTLGYHLLGGNSLMFDVWDKASDLTGRDIILVDFAPGGLSKSTLAGHFDKLGPMTSKPIMKDGRVVTILYWRVGYGYRR